MTALIISVGTELLMGQVLNTDAKFIAQHLAQLGINLYYQLTVGDNSDRLYAAIKDGLEHSDIVILTGGLGPTADDLTKETAAKVMGKTLEYDEASLEILKQRFKAFHSNMTPNNLKQAMFPKDSIILPNPNGTAPGCIMERDGKAVVMLPGPPRELFPMFVNSVMPYLEKRSDCVLYSHVLRIFGVGESTIEHKLKDLIEAQTNPTIAPYALTGEATLRITARCKNAEEAERTMAPVLREIRDRLGDTIYSIDDEPLEVVCSKLLIKKAATLAVCESCTGGLLASTLVSVPGSSKYFLEGMVTYSNAAKERLGVQRSTLERYGAVSEQTACEMAKNILEQSGADYAISTTGIAGPDGGSEEKPVGTVYIGLCDKDGAVAYKRSLTGDRERIRYTSVLHALDLLRRKLL
ncbi:MAG: competence/damage-inducible protein A [Bacillota bacterium]